MTLNLTLNQNPSYSPSHQKILPTSLLGGCSLRAILAKHVPSFAPGTAPPFFSYHGKKFSLVVSLDLLPWGKILMCFLPFLIFLLNPGLPLNTGPKHRHGFSKIGESKFHCLIINKSKAGSFQFLRGPTRFLKFRHTSESLKRHWISVPASFSFDIFDSKTKTNLEGEALYRGPTSVKISDSRIFFGFLLSTLCGQ